MTSLSNLQKITASIGGVGTILLVLVLVSTNINNEASAQKEIEELKYDNILTHLKNIDTNVSTLNDNVIVIKNDIHTFDKFHCAKHTESCN